MHLQKTNSDFLIPMILYLPVQKSSITFQSKTSQYYPSMQLWRYLKVNSLFFRFWNFLKTNFATTYMKEQNQTHTHKVWSDVVFVQRYGCHDASCNSVPKWWFSQKPSRHQNDPVVILSSQLCDEEICISTLYIYIYIVYI